MDPPTCTSPPLADGGCRAAHLAPGDSDRSNPNRRRRQFRPPPCPRHRETHHPPTLAASAGKRAHRPPCLRPRAPRRLADRRSARRLLPPIAALEQAVGCDAGRTRQRGASLKSARRTESGNHDAGRLEQEECRLRGAPGEPGRRRHFLHEVRRFVSNRARSWFVPGVPLVSRSRISRVEFTLEVAVNQRIFVRRAGAGSAHSCSGCADTSSDGSRADRVGQASGGAERRRRRRDGELRPGRYRRCAVRWKHRRGRPGFQRGLSAGPAAVRRVATIPAYSRDCIHAGVSGKAGRPTRP